MRTLVILVAVAAVGGLLLWGEYRPTQTVMRTVVTIVAVAAVGAFLLWGEYRFGPTRTVMRTLVILVSVAAVGAFLLWGVLAGPTEPGCWRGSFGGCACPDAPDPCVLTPPPLSGS